MAKFDTKMISTGGLDVYLYKSGQITIFHQPRFLEIRGFPFLNATFWGQEKSCDVAII